MTETRDCDAVVGTKGRSMISEVVNALLITYAATEFQSNESNRKQHQENEILRFVSNNRWILAGVALVNVLDRVTGAALWTRHTLEQLMHAPKIFLAAVLYTATLYADCVRHEPNLSFLTRFLPKVGMAFIRILPLYPFLAVLISFGFLLVISIFESLHLPLSWLNAPIYYGTLYGPFSLVYFRVKQQIVEEHYYFLPTITNEAILTWDESSSSSTLYNTGGGGFADEPEDEANAATTTLSHNNATYRAPRRNKSLEAALRRQRESRR